MEQIGKRAGSSDPIAQCVADSVGSVGESCRTCACSAAEDCLAATVACREECWAFFACVAESGCDPADTVCIVLACNLFLPAVPVANAVADCVFSCPTCGFGGEVDAGSEGLRAGP